MDDAQHDQPSAGRIASEHDGIADGAPRMDWTRHRSEARTEAALLVHWIDERGSVVRLLTTSDAIQYPFDERR